MLYVLDVTKKFGHHGIYPAPIARWVAKWLSERTGGNYEVFTRAEYKRETGYWLARYPR